MPSKITLWKQMRGLLSTIAASAGLMPTANLGSGTASATTYLRGDQAYAALPNASPTDSGILTTGTQVIAGKKTFGQVVMVGLSDVVTLDVYPFATQTNHQQIWRTTAGVAVVWIDASGRFLAGAGSFTVSNTFAATMWSGGFIGWASSGTVTGTSAIETGFVRDGAAGTIAARVGTQAHSLRTYNTWTNASNYERGVFDWLTTSNTLRIGTEKLGTGTARDLALVTDATVRITIGATTGLVTVANSLIVTGSINKVTVTQPATGSTLTIADGATLTASATATVSGTNTGDQNVFTTIAVSGQSNVVSDAASDTLTLVAGANITITTNAGTDTITIASTSATVATDVIWDAAGDLAVGSGANTAARLAMGTALQGLRVNAGATALEWAVVGNALVANPLSQFASTTSLQLIGVVSDPTGSGSLVFGTSPTIANALLTAPTLTTPVLGVATATSIDATAKSTFGAIVKTPQAYTPAIAGTATLDCSLGDIHRIAMPAGNITIALSSITDGQSIQIAITQDGVGSRTVTWFATIRWAGGSAPTLTTTASKRDVIVINCTGTGTYDGFVLGANI